MKDKQIAEARKIARELYEGVKTPHRSCGIAIAETFSFPTAAFQSLRRGGITGCGECGALVAGRLVLGMMLGDPEPTGAVTPALRDAIRRYDALMSVRLNRGAAPDDSNVCNDLTEQFVSFHSKERAGFCTDIAAEVANAVAEVALEFGYALCLSDALGGEGT